MASLSLLFSSSSLDFASLFVFSCAAFFCVASVFQGFHLLFPFLLALLKLLVVAGFVLIALSI